MLFKVMDCLMERRSDAVLPHSLSDTDRGWCMHTTHFGTKTFESFAESSPLYLLMC